MSTFDPSLRLWKCKVGNPNLLMWASQLPFLIGDVLLAANRHHTISRWPCPAHVQLDTHSLFTSNHRTMETRLEHITGPY